MMVAAEKQNSAVGAVLGTIRSFERLSGDKRSQALLITMSRARITVNNVRSMVLPAKSALDSDLALSVASSTSTGSKFDGSSKGPRSLETVDCCCNCGPEGTPFNKANDTEAETSLSLIHI